MTNAAMTYATIEPMNRATVWKISPMRSASFATAETTSPVGSSAVIVCPDRATR